MGSLAYSLLDEDSPTTLWLLDGFDELLHAEAIAEYLGLASAHPNIATRRAARRAASERAWAPLDSTTESPVKALLGILVLQPRVVVTTRPRFSEQLGVTQFIELEPLTVSQVTAFVSSALSADEGARDRLLRRIRESPAFADAVCVPVIMQMAISIERPRPRVEAPLPAARAGDSETTCVITALYMRLLDFMKNRFFERWSFVEPLDDRNAVEAWVAAEPLLQRAALSGCTDGASAALLLWPHDDARLLASLRDARIIDVIRGGYIEFAHRSVQEFIAAGEVLRQIAAGAGSPADTTARDALVHANNDTLRGFAFSLAPDTGAAAALLAVLGVADQTVLPSGRTLEVVAACLPRFRGLRVLPLAATLRTAARSFWVDAERGVLQASV